MSDQRTSIHNRILAVLRAHPEGISITDTRTELGLAANEHQHLDRRVRDLDDSFDIARVRVGTSTHYILKGNKAVPIVASTINKTLRSRILWRAQGRCEMCGRTIVEDGVRLNIDHKIPREWGGPSIEENLWALCSTCNEGKRDFFATIIDPRVQQAMLHPSVHVRLGELLKAFEGSPVSSQYLELVAYSHDDWQKRLRELRELGWEYHFRKHKDETTGRIQVHFILDRWSPWPNNPSVAIRAAERLKHSKPDH